MIQLITTFAQAGQCTNRPDFLDVIPSWYKYLDMKKDSLGECAIQFDLIKNNKFNGGDILLVGLGVIDILIRIAALVAVAFVLYGGIKYITSQGSPDATKSAQNTILNALIGLAIAIVAAAVVAFLGNYLTR
jgi:uncharacterized membrane protein